MLNTWIAAPWIRLACELVGLDPADYCAMTPSDLRALIRERHAAAQWDVRGVHRLRGTRPSEL